MGAEWFAGRHEELAAGDYVSPNLEVVIPDRAFMHLAIGNPAGHAWPHLRRGVPHNWYCDDRDLTTGFVTRDEAAILYNTAKKFCGERMLEIGCWRGWSTVHLALGAGENGRVDVVDAAIMDGAFRADVEETLRAAGVRERVHLYPGLSPARVFLLAMEGVRWRVMFIDGNHVSPGPVEDAQACAKYAEKDAVILLHDLASPDVGAALAYLEESGWEVGIYQTMQIMGAAWRGGARPVEHRPDPRIELALPEHLRGFELV